MGDVIVGIHQPNFMPWLGYFQKISQSDHFIFLDDVQLQKTGASYVNRVAVNINGTLNYITVPISRQSGVWSINETRFANDKWQSKLIKTLQASYGKTPYFRDHSDFVFNLLNSKADNIAEYNMNIIIQLSTLLGIDTTFHQSSYFKVSQEQTLRLVELVKAVGGTSYLSGSGGANYQEEELYQKNNIVLRYTEKPSFVYPQVKVDEFMHGLSVVDVLFNAGVDNLKNYLKDIK